MARRIGGAGGGSDKGASTSGLILAGAVTAIAVAYAGGGGGVPDGPSDGTFTESVSEPNMAARKANGKRAARQGNTDEAWSRMGLRGVNKALKQDLQCVLNSFGKIREFFLHTPCMSLDRALFAVADERGNIIVVSVAWVGFRTRTDARRFKELDDVHGSGNVSPLGGALLGVADVRFTGQHYASRNAGPMTVIAEAEPLSGTASDEVLDGIAEVAVLLPRP